MSAHNLRDALPAAAALPLSAWFPDEAEAVAPVETPPAQKDI